MAALLKVGGGIAMGKVKNGLGIQVKDAELLATLTEGADEFEALHKRHKEAFDKVSLPLIGACPSKASKTRTFSFFVCDILRLHSPTTTTTTGLNMKTSISLQVLERRQRSSGGVGGRGGGFLQDRALHPLQPRHTRCRPLGRTHHPSQGNQSSGYPYILSNIHHLASSPSALTSGVELRVLFGYVGMGGVAE